MLAVRLQLILHARARSYKHEWGFDMLSRLRWPQRHGTIAPSLSSAEASGMTGESERATRRTPGSRRLSRIGLFWSAQGVGGVTDPFMASGKYVAATALTRAFARYGKIPNVDIFAPLGRMDLCIQQLHGLPAHVYGAETAVARLFPESDIPALFQAHSYGILHEPIDVDFTRSSYVRSRLARQVFPITCSQMGISYSTQLQFGLIRMLTAQIYSCDAVVCSTQAARRAMEERLSDLLERYSHALDRPAPSLPRLEVIPWGVDTHFFIPRDQAAARHDLDLPPDRPIVLCVGRVRIEDKMDWTPLLLAFDRVKRTAKHRPLFILAGSSASDYAQKVISHATQLGLAGDIRTFFNLPPACLPSLYSACDVFVSPVDSPTETFGLTIVEAMACGRPVIASDWDGYKELIVHGETGFKVRTDWADCLGEIDRLAPFLVWDHEHLHVGQSVCVNVPQMAGYLMRLLGDPELRADMGRRGRARVENLYDWPVVIAQWEALWSELVSIAQTITREEWDRLDYLQPRYFQHFSHYASRIIDDATSVELTPRGDELLAGKVPLFLHPWAEGFLHPECLHACLAALKPAARMGAKPEVGDLVKILHKARGLTRDRALMHLMWLAKYDLISFGECELPSS